MYHEFNDLKKISGNRIPFALTISYITNLGPSGCIIVRAPKVLLRRKNRTLTFSEGCPLVKRLRKRVLGLGAPKLRSGSVPYGYGGNV